MFKKLFLPFFVSILSLHFLAAQTTQFDFPSNKREKLISFLLVPLTLNPQGDEQTITVSTYAILCTLIATTEEGYQQISKTPVFSCLTPIKQEDGSYLYHAKEGMERVKLGWGEVFTRKKLLQKISLFEPSKTDSVHIDLMNPHLSSFIYLNIRVDNNLMNSLIQKEVDSGVWDSTNTDINIEKFVSISTANSEETGGMYYTLATNNADRSNKMLNIELYINDDFNIDSTKSLANKKLPLESEWTFNFLNQTFSKKNYYSN